MSKKPTQPFDRILVGLHLKKSGSGLTREQAMAAWPVRNPSLTYQTTDDGTVKVDLPRRKDWMGGLLSFAFMVPDSRPVQLDDVGTLVWGLCDGEHTVSDVLEALCNEYKLNRREVEVSLTQYLQTLGKRGMIAFAVPKEVAEEAGLKGQALAFSDPEAEAAEDETEP
jgi:hypothetical protein